MSGEDDAGVAAGTILAFVGSLNRRHPDFPSSDGNGISCFRFDRAFGRLSPLGGIANIDNPSFLLVDGRRGRLYATSEVAEWNEGTVTAYAFDAWTGALSYLNKQPTLGRAPCYLAFDATARNVIVVNYGNGSGQDRPGQGVAILPLRPDGGLEPAATTLTAGCGVVGPGPFHPHSAITSPDGRFLLVADAGAGFVSVHRFDGRTGTVQAAAFDRLQFSAGCAPRHLAFHPRGRLVYATDESASAVAVMAFDAGALSLVEMVSTLAQPDRTTINHPADIAISRSGKYLYASNRGQDGVASFSIEAGTGRLERVAETPAGGTPRSLALDAAGRFLLIGQQTAPGIAVMAIDPATGVPGSICAEIALGSPTAIRLVEPDVD